MLASPFRLTAPFSPTGPKNTSEDSLSFRPARDVDAFNSLLPPPIEFVEGSSSGTLAVPEGRYQPINVSPKLSAKDVRAIAFYCHILHCCCRGPMQLAFDTSLLPHRLPLKSISRHVARHRLPRIYPCRFPESTWRGQRHATAQLVCITLGILVF